MAHPRVVIEEIFEDQQGQAAEQPAPPTDGEGAVPAADSVGEQASAAVEPEAQHDPSQQAGEDTVEPASDQASLERAEALKQEGNTLFATGKMEEAMDKYSQALDAAPEAAPERAVYFGNRAACHLKLGQHADAAADCSAALEVQPGYIKVLLRRSTAYEALDDLERALMDVQKVLELEPDNSLAKRAVQRLEPVVNERREKLKEEMLGKLKDLGNTVLGKFGLSLDNFKAEKDPQTGSYSIKFSQ